MKALRIITNYGTIVMCYLSKPTDKKYGIAFAGKTNLNFPELIDTEDFEKSIDEWIENNKENSEAQIEII